MAGHAMTERLDLTSHMQDRMVITDSLTFGVAIMAVQERIGGEPQMFQFNKVEAKEMRDWLNKFIGE